MGKHAAYRRAGQRCGCPCQTPRAVQNGLDVFPKGSNVMAGIQGAFDMFTLEIGGKPIALIDADHTEAVEFFEAETFKQDMQRWISDGKPIWDGQAEFNVRAASGDEIAHFRGPDPNPPHGTSDEDPLVMFLIDAYDPDDLEED